MHQIRIHGRGGQGVVTAAELIAIAAFKDGHIAQAFPAFGVERTGAPIEAFARIDDREIRTREQVNSPDIIIVQDATLIGTVDILRGCGKNTIAIINTSKKKEELNLKLPKENIYTVDATKIALENLGKNIVNTTILGAFARATGLTHMEALKEAIKEKFGEKDQEVVAKNIRAIESAYNSGTAEEIPKAAELAFNT